MGSNLELWSCRCHSARSCSDEIHHLYRCRWKQVSPSIASTSRPRSPPVVDPGSLSKVISNSGITKNSRHGACFHLLYHNMHDTPDLPSPRQVQALVDDEQDIQLSPSRSSRVTSPGPRLSLELGKKRACGYGLRYHHSLRLGVGKIDCHSAGVLVVLCNTPSKSLHGWMSIMMIKSSESDALHIPPTSSHAQLLPH